MFGRKKNLEQDHAPQADKQYEKKYTEDSFWDKVGTLGRKKKAAEVQQVEVVKTNQVMLELLVLFLF